MVPYLHGAAKHSIFLHILRLQQLQKREKSSDEKCRTSSSLMSFISSVCPAWLLSFAGGKEMISAKKPEKSSDETQSEGCHQLIHHSDQANGAKHRELRLTAVKINFYLSYIEFFVLIHGRKCLHCTYRMTKYSHQMMTSQQHSLWEQLFGREEPCQEAAIHQ